MKIQYKIEPKTGLTYSRVGSEVAVPVKDRRNKFGTWDYKLLLFHASSLGNGEWSGLQDIDNLPVSIRHYHMQFWNKRKEDK